MFHQWELLKCGSIFLGRPNGYFCKSLSKNISVYLKHCRILATFINRTFNPGDPLLNRSLWKPASPKCKLFMTEINMAVRCLRPGLKLEVNLEVTRFDLVCSIVLEIIFYKNLASHMGSMSVINGPSCIAPYCHVYHTCSLDDLQGFCNSLEWFMCYIKSHVLNVHKSGNTWLIFLLFRSTLVSIWLSFPLCLLMLLVGFWDEGTPLRSCFSFCQSALSWRSYRLMFRRVILLEKPFLYDFYNGSHFREPRTVDSFAALGTVKIITQWATLLYSSQFPEELFFPQQWFGFCTITGYSCMQFCFGCALDPGTGAISFCFPYPCKFLHLSDRTKFLMWSLPFKICQANFQTSLNSDRDEVWRKLCIQKRSDYLFGSWHQDWRSNTQ